MLDSKVKIHEKIHRLRRRNALVSMSNRKDSRPNSDAPHRDGVELRHSAGVSKELEVHTFPHPASL